MGKMKDVFMDERQAEMYAEDVQNRQGLLRFAEMSITKKLMTEQSAAMVEAVMEGEIDPLKAVCYLNAVEKMVRDVRGKIMVEAVEEFAKYHEREIILMEGCHVSQAEAGVRYDFSNTPAWNEIKEREDAIATERKELESTLKTIKQPGVMSIEDEVVDVNPPIRTSTTVVKVTIK